MSYVQPALSSGESQTRKSAQTGSLAIGVIAGLALLGLGLALFGLGVFHGFQNGSCSTTGYSAHYGQVNHCGKGVGWWMLMLLAGLLLAGVGAALSGAAGVAGGLLFVAIGTPFLALALFSGNIQLMNGASPTTGKLYAGIFGACFVISGLVWAGISGRGVTSRSGSSLFGGLIASVLGVGLAFAIAAGVAGAIGTSTTTSTLQVSQGSGQSSTATGQSNAAAAATNAAVSQATTAANKAAKLATCVTAAGADTAKIQACEAKYTP